jgi:hypothetical protein
MNRMSVSVRCVSGCRKYKFSGMQRTTSCNISPRSSSSLRSCAHGEAFQGLATVRPVLRCIGVTELTSVSPLRGSYPVVSSSGFSICRRKCVRSELYAERVDESVRTQVAVSRLSNSKKSFQHVERPPAVAIDKSPSKRTASFRSRSDWYCRTSSHAARASSNPRIVYLTDARRVELWHSDGARPKIL